MPRPIEISGGSTSGEAVFAPPGRGAGSEAPRWWQPPVLPAIGAEPPPARLSNAARSVLLIGFGALLGWSASGIVHFYERAPSPSRGMEYQVPRTAPLSQKPAPPPDKAAVSGPEGIIALEALPAPGPPVPSLALLGGQDAPDRSLLFCSVLVVNPSACDRETRLRTDEPGAQQPATAQRPLPSAPARLVEAGKRSRDGQRGRPGPSFPRPAAQPVDPSSDPEGTSLPAEPAD